MTIRQVKEFHQKFDLPDGAEDKLLTDEHMQNFRLTFLVEELNELDESLKSQDRVKAFDALLDLAYVIYGTALMLGITPEVWHAGMDVVHRANMTKVRAQRAEESKRGSTFDVVKPADWTAPEKLLEKILEGNT